MKTTTKEAELVPENMIPMKELRKAQTSERLDLEKAEFQAPKLKKISTETELNMVSSIKAALQDKQKQWKSRFSPITKALNVVKKLITDLDKDVSDEYTGRIEVCDKLINGYILEQRMIAAENRRKEEEKAQQIERDRQAAMEAARKAKTPQARGKALDKIADLDEAAEAIIENASDDGRVRTDDFTTRVVLKCRVTDQTALMNYIVSMLKSGKRDLSTLVEVDMSELEALRQMDEINEPGAAWLPGVEVYEEVTNVRKRT